MDTQSDMVAHRRTFQARKCNPKKQVRTAEMRDTDTQQGTRPFCTRSLKLEQRQWRGSETDFKISTLQWKGCSDPTTDKSPTLFGA